MLSIHHTEKTDPTNLFAVQLAGTTVLSVQQDGTTHHGVLPYLRPATEPSIWVTDALPDSEITVLLRLDNSELPLFTGFHDGEAWRLSDASLVTGAVLGWMHLEDAAVLLAP